MKVCVAQIKSNKDSIENNIDTHIKWINIATSLKVDLIVFPELSITSYETASVNQLATTETDIRLQEFQKISNLKNIVIGIGLPIKSKSGIFISIVFFHPNNPKQIYSKQQLHSDEIPYFIEGDKQLILKVENKKIAPAICYESLQPKHFKNAIKMEAEIYLACVSKPQSGLEKAFKHYSITAKKYSIPILMSNSIGYCDNFLSAGQSSIWDENGELIGQLDSENEGILIYDTKTREVIKHN